MKKKTSADLLARGPCVGFKHKCLTKQTASPVTVKVNSNWCDYSRVGDIRQSEFASLSADS